MSQPQPSAPQPNTPTPSQGQSKAFEAFKAFWTTFPGILTAIGGLIAALAALISSLDKAALLRRPTPLPPTAVVSQAASPSPVLSLSPLPTATEAPSPAPTVVPSPTSLLSPTAAQPAEGALLMDDFSDGTAWDVGGDADYEISYKDGEYRVVVHRADTFAWGNPKRSYNLSDLTIEVDARHVAGAADSSIGLVVRRQDDKGFYLFAISSDGTYGVDMLKNDTWSNLVKWTLSKSVKQDTEWNHLRVECVGTRMRFYVNGDLLAEVEDKTFASGNVGLGVGTVDEGGVEVRFDNLRLQVLKRL